MADTDSGVAKLYLDYQAMVHRTVAVLSVAVDFAMLWCRKGTEAEALLL